MKKQDKDWMWVFVIVFWLLVAGWVLFGHTANDNAGPTPTCAQYGNC